MPNPFQRRAYWFPATTAPAPEKPIENLNRREDNPLTTVKDLMERVSTIIAENPDRSSEFGGVYKFDEMMGGRK